MPFFSDFLENQVHKTVAELTQKTMQNRKANEKPELGEEFTKELANKMIEDLGNHKQYGDIFKGLNPKHKAVTLTTPKHSKIGFFRPIKINHQIYCKARWCI